MSVCQPGDGLAISPACFPAQSPIQHLQHPCRPKQWLGEWMDGFQQVLLRMNTKLIVMKCPIHVRRRAAFYQIQSDVMTVKCLCDCNCVFDVNHAQFTPFTHIFLMKAYFINDCVDKYIYSGISTLLRLAWQKQTKCNPYRKAVYAVSSSTSCSCCCSPHYIWSFIQILGRQVLHYFLFL